MMSVRLRTRILLAALAGLELRTIAAVLADPKAREAMEAGRREYVLVGVDEAATFSKDMIASLKVHEPVICTHEPKEKPQPWQRPRFDNRKMQSMRARSRR